MRGICDPESHNPYTHPLFVESLFSERSRAQLNAGSYRIESLVDIEDAADELRTSWGLGSAPIDSVVSAFEEHGVKAVIIHGIEGFDGFSCYANQSIPVIAIPAGMAGDRQRFTLAHSTLASSGRQPTSHCFACSVSVAGVRTNPASPYLKNTRPG